MGLADQKQQHARVTYVVAHALLAGALLYGAVHFRRSKPLFSLVRNTLKLRYNVQVVEVRYGFYDVVRILQVYYTEGSQHLVYVEEVDELQHDHPPRRRLALIQQILVALYKVNGSGNRITHCIDREVQDEVPTLPVILIVCMPLHQVQHINKQANLD